jgi:hypothetical protein
LHAESLTNRSGQNGLRRPRQTFREQGKGRVGSLHKDLGSLPANTTRLHKNIGSQLKRLGSLQKDIGRLHDILGSLQHDFGEGFFDLNLQKPLKIEARHSQYFQQVGVADTN